MARLGLLLVRADLVEENHLARALGIQHFAGGRLGTLLLERGSIDEDSLGKTLALQQGCDYIPWKVLGEISPVVIAALPAKFAIKHSAIPYERGENYLKLVLRDPGNLRILDELFFVTGRKIIAGVAPEVRIYQALEKYYGERRTPRYAILAEKLSRPSRASRAFPTVPPPPPDFFPSPPSSRRKPAPPPEPRDVWEDAPQSDSAEPPIIQAWQMPDEIIGGWAGTVSPGFGPAPSGEPETITWEEMPSFPSLWLPEPVVLSPASQVVPSSEAMTGQVEPVWVEEAGVFVLEPLAPSSPAPPPAPAPPPPPEAEVAPTAELPAVVTPTEAPPEPSPSAPPIVEPEPVLGSPPAPEPGPAAPEPVSGEAAAASVETQEQVAEPEQQVAPAPAAAPTAHPPPRRDAAPASLLAMPSAADFPEVTSATDRDSIATGALTALARRFLRGAVFVARPDVVTAWGGAGEGISADQLRDIAIPWKEPSVFLNVRLSRSFYLGPLPPLPRHEAIAMAMGGWPDECLLQPVLIKEKPVAFLYAEFTRDHGATPMDLAYMRELAAAASSAFVSAIRLKKKEI